VSATAFLFTGQGGQTAGMLTEELAETPHGRELLARADERMGIPLSRLMRVGPDRALFETTVAQPALVILGVLHARHLRERGVEPRLLAGHSVGQFAALVTAGALEIDDALDLVRVRARLMAAAMPAEGGSMAAILGADREAVYAACRDYPGPGAVGVACHNAPGQTVISGSSPAVEAVADQLEEAGFGVAPLAVSVAAHSSLLEPAALAFAPVVAACPVAPPTIPVVDNVTARPLMDAGGVRESIVRQLTAPVLFEESVGVADSMGVGTFIECGPGDTLVRCVRRRLPAAACFTFREAAGSPTQLPAPEAIPL
jgi:[acyl-carrier-protein] S-malonyltransferase